MPAIILSRSGLVCFVLVLDTKLFSTAFQIISLELTGIEILIVTSSDFEVRKIVSRSGPILFVWVLDTKLFSTTFQIIPLELTVEVLSLRVACAELDSVTQ